MKTTAKTMIAVTALCVNTACISPEPGGSDAGNDTGIDAIVDTRDDARVDALIDAHVDTRDDGSVDAASDASIDTWVDASDALTDAYVDALIDVNEEVCIDNDNDGYGINCTLGADCDDADAFVWDDCSGVGAGVFSLSAPSYSVSEAMGTVEIAVLRLGGSQGAVSVAYSTLRLGDGQPPYAQDADFSTPGDYDGQYATLNFADGVESQSFSITIYDDSTVESDESFEVYLLEPSGGASIGSTNSRATVTIVDDDEPSTSVCPDGHCDTDETCLSCRADCGPCANICGDDNCDANESCSSCEADCGVCSSGATFVGNFDSGALGSAPTGTDGYSDGVAQGPRKAAYDATRAFSGTQSAKINTETGEMFFGIAAMSVPGGNLAQGDEIWRQEKFWIPSSFDFTGGQPAVKWINYAPNDGTGRVYWNLRAGGWSLISETDSSSGYLSISAPIPRDQWVTVETWMKVTAVSEPCMRLWVNGVFLGEKTTTTIARSSNLIDEIRLGDYWNTGAPSNQSFWVDDLKIYSSRAGNIPTRFDSGGRRFIGID